MTIFKIPETETHDAELQSAENDRKTGTAVDDSDMQRMGKAQELKVLV